MGLDSIKRGVHGVASWKAPKGSVGAFWNNVTEISFVTASCCV